MGDNNAQLMLRCVASAFRALLRPAESVSAAAGDGEPSEPLTAFMASKPVESVTEIDKVLGHLKEREPSSADAASLAQLQHLAQWVTDLCLQGIASLTDGRHKQVSMADTDSSTWQTQTYQDGRHRQVRTADKTGQYGRQNRSVWQTQTGKDGRQNRSVRQTQTNLT